MSRTDIQIYRCNHDYEFNYFLGREGVDRREVVIKTKTVLGKKYTYAEPAVAGPWAFGRTILCTCNGLFPEFNTPRSLRRMIWPQT